MQYCCDCGVVVVGPGPRPYARTPGKVRQDVRVEAGLGVVGRSGGDGWGDGAGIGRGGQNRPGSTSSAMSAKSLSVCSE